MNQRDGISINEDSIYEEYIDGSSKDKAQEVQSMKIKPKIRLKWRKRIHIDNPNIVGTGLVIVVNDDDEIESKETRTIA